MKNIIKLSSAITLLLLFACEKEPVENANQNKLIGTWHMAQRVNAKTFGKTASDISNGSLSSWNFVTVLTTNSDQEAIDLYSEGNGSIDVTGAESVSFKYMFPSRYEDHDTGVESISIFLINESFASFGVNYPVFGLMLSSGGDNPSFFSSGDNPMYHDSGLVVWKDDSTWTQYDGDVDFTYDGKTLTVNESSLNGKGGSGSVSVKGSLAHQTITIPANTPTPIHEFKEENVSLEQGGWTIEIREDGSWVELYQWEDWVDSLKASWEVENDLLKVTYDFSDWWDAMGDSTSYEYVIEFNYKIENNELLLTNEYDICGDNFRQDCLAWSENKYGLDSGSLESIIDRLSLTFTQTQKSSGKILASEPDERAQRRIIEQLNAFLSGGQ